MKPNKFEIVYNDATVVTGESAAEFEAAPGDGIQFVVVRDEKNFVVIHKAQDEYEYRGVVKAGAWTDAANYASLKSRIPELSKLVYAGGLDSRTSDRANLARLLRRMDPEAITAALREAFGK